MEDEMQIMFQSAMGFDIKEQLHSVYQQPKPIKTL